MEAKAYTINLADGSVINNLRMNGSTFVSQSPVDPAIFDNNCSPVTISDGETEEIHANMEPVPCAQPSKGEYWFALRDVPQKEMLEMQLRADVDFLAAMQGVDL